MDTPELSVYGEAKGEYTRQLCVFLVPVLEQYFIDLLAESKQTSPSPQKVLWQFQSNLQNIPDWNQDKVLRETDKIQKETKCDYLEELLTAVFIAHTKVLSAIRLTTKQKKLQITIPKLDHFLHRVLSECARSLWTNAFLFADTNSIEKQKNLRQVSSLLQESILQAIRGMLPVKSILREYLHEDEEEEEQPEKISETTSDSISEQPLIKEDVKEDNIEEQKEEPKEEANQESKEQANQEPKEEAKEEAKEEPKEEPKEEANQEPKEEPKVKEDLKEIVSDSELKQQTIVIDTKPTVSFTQEHVFFDSDNLEQNAIENIPFAEAELRPASPQEFEDDDEYNDEIFITDEILPMDADQIIE